MTSSPLIVPLVDGDVLLIDNSSLEKFTTCPRSAQYALIDQRVPAGERIPLRFGGIIHKILETRYRSATAMHAQSPQVEEVMRAVAIDEFSKWSPPEDDFHNFSTTLSFIHEYGLAYPFESFDILRFPDGRPLVEVPFAFPLGEVITPTKTIKVMWQGRIDLVYESNGAIYFMDHKTTSIMGPSYFSQFELSHQFYGYAWAVEQLLGRVVAGGVVNALGIRKPSKTGKAIELKRQLIPIQRPLLEDWRTDCLHIVADYLEHARRGYFPKHTAWCVGKFGECPYRKVCTLDTPEQRQMMLSSGEYQTNTWSPLT